MSADVLSATARPVRPAASDPGRWVARAEPSLLNRLLAVAAAVFAVPLGIELLGWFVGAHGPQPAVQLGASIACGVLAGGFALLVFGLGRAAPELRLARRLTLLLAGQTLLLCLALLAPLYG
jgi:hypothetical protein